MQDILFEPIVLGSKRLANRLIAVPVSGTLHSMWQRAAGGYAAVFTGEVFVEPYGVPANVLGLYSHADVLRETALRVRRYGALPGIELAYDPRPEQSYGYIEAVLGDGAEQAATFGYDLISFYSAHGGGAFLRGTLRQRVNVAQSVLQQARKWTDAALGIRYQIDVPGSIEFIRELDPYVDYWDFVVGSYPDFLRSTLVFPVPLGYATKPVIGVGRFVDPDMMRKVLELGVLDIIGLGRPAIADPYMPMKLRQGEHWIVRACTGCNGCVDLYERNEPVDCIEDWSRLIPEA